MSDKQVSITNASGSSAWPVSAAKPVDHVAEALNEATAAVTGISKRSTIYTIRTDVEHLLKSLVPPPPQDMPHPKNSSTDPLVAPYWHQHQLDLAKADLAFADAEAVAAAALDGELNNWSQTKTQYAFAMSTAHTAMTQAVMTATDAYKAKDNLDTHSRSLYLYFTMQAAVAAAIQDHQKDATSAAAALASEAGALLAAHATFLDAIGTAQSNLLASQTAAKQACWLALEQIRDAV